MASVERLAQLANVNIESLTDALEVRGTQLGLDSEDKLEVMHLTSVLIARHLQEVGYHKAFSSSEEELPEAHRVILENMAKVNLREVVNMVCCSEHFKPMIDSYVVIVSRLAAEIAP